MKPKKYRANLHVEGYGGSYVVLLNLTGEQNLPSYPGPNGELVVPLVKKKNSIDLDYPGAHYLGDGRSFKESYRLRDKQRRLLEEFVGKDNVQKFLKEATSEKNVRVTRTLSVTLDDQLTFDRREIRPKSSKGQRVGMSKYAPEY
jgi:hypothetical protein